MSADVPLFTVADYVVCVLMFVLSAAIGVYHAWKSRREETMTDYLLGGKIMGVVPVAISLAVTYKSAITVVGTPAEVYVYGTHYATICLAVCLVIPPTVFFFVPVFRSIQGASAYEYFEARFNRNVRTLAALIFLLAMIMLMGVITYAPALALSQVTGLSIWFCVLSIGLVCTFYSSIGGFKAVVWTDVFQATILLASIILVIIKGVVDAGGIAAVWNKNVEGKRIEFFNTTPDATVRHTVWSIIFGGFILWMGMFNTNQVVVQRCLTLPTLRKAQLAVSLSMPMVVFVIITTSFMGLLIYAKYADCDPISTGRVSNPDQLLPLFVMDTLGFLPGLPGLFVAGIFSAALSTFSSLLNALTAVTVEDIVITYIAPKMTDKWQTILAKILTTVYGVVCIVLVAILQNMGQVLQASIVINGLVLGPLLGLYTLGMCFPSANPQGALAGVATGAAVSLWISIGSILHPTPSPKAPVSVNGCKGLNSTTNLIANMTTTLNPDVVPQDSNDEFIMYRLSYLWYAAIGFFLVIIVGNIVSCFTGCNKGKRIDPKYISPPVNKLRYWAGYDANEVDKSTNKRKESENETIELKTKL